MSATSQANWVAIRELQRARPRSRVVRWSAGLLALLVLAAWFSGEIAVSDLFSGRRASNLVRCGIRRSFGTGRAALRLRTVLFFNNGLRFSQCFLNFSHASNARVGQTIKFRTTRLM